MFINIILYYFFFKSMLYFYYLFLFEDSNLKDKIALYFIHHMHLFRINYDRVFFILVLYFFFVKMVSSYHFITYLLKFFVLFFIFWSANLFLGFYCFFKENLCISVQVILTKYTFLHYYYQKRAKFLILQQAFFVNFYEYFLILIYALNIFINLYELLYKKAYHLWLSLEYKTLQHQNCKFAISMEEFAGFYF